jgi:hypothetical protein
MTSGNRAEHPAGGESTHSPYGRTGQRVGELAHMLQGRLASPDKELPYAPGERPRWDDEDRLVFGYVLELEDSLSALAHEQQVSDINRRFPAVFIYGSCLAYGDNQLRWFLAAREAAWGVTPEEAYELIKRGGSFPYEELIMRSWKTPEWDPSYDGAHLAAQWPEWRRGLGEHSDPLLLSDAVEALDKLERETIPRE